MLGPPPFAVSVPAFRFKALALVAGRAPLGGARETALAVLVGARLAAGMLSAVALAADVRAARADAARNWLASIAVPPVTKVVVSRLIDATTRDDVGAAATAVAKVTEVTAPYLDRAAHSELDRLAAALRG